MKSINISGTTSEVFRIGEGTNAADLRVIEGKIYFRNFGDTFKELLSNDAEITLSPISWTSSRDYSVGDLIYYNQSLFQVIQNHKSGNNFINTSSFYRRISNVNNLTKIDVNSFLTNSTQLNILSSNYIHIIGSAIGEFAIIMPYSNSIGIGSQYLIQNASNKRIIIYDNNNTFITQLNPNENKIIIFLGYNGNNDSWTSLTVTSNINFDIKKITFQNNQQYKFIGPSGVFSVDRAGKYGFFDPYDANLNGDIYWATGGNDCKIISFSDKVVSGDSLEYFCFFNINNDLYLKNNTGVTREILFHSIYS